MSRSAARIALVCALVGLAASTAAAYVHYHLLFDPNYTSFCDVNATVSCTQVYMSRYSTFRGIPVAIFGAIWFAFAALLAITPLIAKGEARESAPGYLFAASTLALAVVLYFEYVSFVVLKAVCVLCLTMAAAVVGLFFLSGSTTPFPMTTLPRRAARDLRALMTSPIAIVVTLLFLGGAASALAFFPREGAATPVETAATAAPTEPPPAPTQAQASEFDKGPNRDGESDDVQDEPHAVHLVADPARNSRPQIDQGEPPRRLVAVVQTLGPEGEADPKQRNIENDENCHGQEGFGELVLSHHYKREQQ